MSGGHYRLSGDLGNVVQPSDYQFLNQDFSQAKPLLCLASSEAKHHVLQHVYSPSAPFTLKEGGSPSDRHWSPHSMIP